MGDLRRIKLNYNADEPTLNGRIYPKDLYNKIIDECVSQKINIYCRHYELMPDGSLNGLMSTGVIDIIDDIYDFVINDDKSKLKLIGNVESYDENTKEFLVQLTDENISNAIDKEHWVLTSFVTAELVDDKSCVVQGLEKVNLLYLTDEFSNTYKK